MEHAVDFESQEPCLQRKVQKLTKWVESMQYDSDESDVGYFTHDGAVCIDDRDIAKCAIAVAKAGAKKGFVSLCTCIARILKQNAKLRKKLQYLRAQRDAECPELVSRTGFSRCSKSTSESLQQGSFQLPQNLLLNYSNSKSFELKTKTEDSDKDTCNPTSKNQILTFAVVHQSEQSVSPDQELASGHKDASSEQFACDEKSSAAMNESQETHLSRFFTSKSSPVKMHSHVYQSSSKSKSPITNTSPSFGSPKLTNIYEDMPLDVTCLNDSSTEVPIEDLTKACIIICCKATCKDTDKWCKCARHWFHKYSEIFQRFKEMEQKFDILRKEQSNPRSPNGHFNELPAEKITNGVEEKFSSIASGKEVQECSDANDINEQDWLNRLMLQNLTPLMAPSPLKGCKCSVCELAVQQQVLKAVNEDEIEVFELMSKGQPLLEVSDQIMIPGKTIAQVAYIGHLDSTDMPAAVFVGVTVDKPIGNCNGRNGRKQYFECEPKHGIFMPINQILFVVSHATAVVEETKKKPPLRKWRSHSQS